jgi:Rrf2 family protein
MPLISTKGVYGLTAMYELSKYQEDTPMQIKEISANANIPQNYLEQLLSKLRRANLVKSVRGARGGYTLARSAEEIKIVDILIALEDDIKIIDEKA